MPNLILHTEDFLDAEWTNNNITITANFAAAPASLGASAALATKFDDPSAALQTSLLGTFYAVAANSTVIATKFFRKDAVTSRQPSLGIGFTGGTPKSTAVILNTSTGVATVPTGDGSAPTDFGVIDFDASWWRVWVKQTDVGSNTLVRLTAAAANYDNFGDFASGVTTGSYIGGYANLMVASAVSAYEPNPPYVNEISVFLGEPVIGSSIF